MKDEKGHGSDVHSGSESAAHQTGVEAASRTAAFNIAKAAHDKLNADHAQASAAMGVFLRGPYWHDIGRG